MQTLASARVAALSPRPHARVAAGDAMWKVVEQMKAMGRGAVLVEEDGALVGIFTERDLLNRVDYTDALWSHLIVRDVMTPHPMVIRPDDSLSEALRRLTGGHRRHLPIVDDRGHVLGLISIRDILTFVAERFPEEMLNLPPHPDHES
ncbi:MAG TPA: CBS domain-containing protein [Kofleriaceae bacterium]|jgi:CBS domain-containing protein|nr:CBS domain-containing protein [Kofleriaceae bacterium]